MPSLLLYDTQGLQYFTKITEAKDYYSTQSEVSILEEHAQEIIGTVTADSVFLELGAGYDTVDEFHASISRLNARVRKDS